MTCTTATMELQIPGGDLISVEVTIEGSVSPPDPATGYGGSVEDLAITRVEGSGKDDIEALDDYLADEIWQAAANAAEDAYDSAMEAKGDAMRERRAGL